MNVFSIDVYFDGGETLADCGVCDEYHSSLDAAAVRDWVDVHARTHGIDNVEFFPAISGSSQGLAVVGAVGKAKRARAKGEKQ